jgi:hypothetical protein
MWATWKQILAQEDASYTVVVPILCEYLCNLLLGFTHQVVYNKHAVVNVQIGVSFDKFIR